MKRRHFLTGLGCATATGAMIELNAPARAAIPQELPKHDLPPEMMPRMVRIRAGFAPYEVHVDPNQFALYWTLPGQEALRYVCGVGKPGLCESGTFTVGARKEWPSWTPTPGMLERQPELYGPHEDGIPAGWTTPRAPARSICSNPRAATPSCAFTAPTTPRRWAGGCRTAVPG